MLYQFFLSILAGCIIGLVFSWLKLPIPAPPPMGLVGAAGITLGAYAFQWISTYLKN